MDDMLIPLISSYLFSRDMTINNIFLMLFVNLLVYNYKSIISFINFDLFNIKNAEFRLKAKITYRHNILYDTSFSQKFLALCHKIKNKLNDTNLHNIQVMEFQKYLGNTNTNDTDGDDVLFFLIKNPFLIDENIYVKTLIKTVNSNVGPNSTHECKSEYIDLEIILTTPLNNFVTIKNYIDEAVREYKLEKINTMKEQHIFLFNKYDIEKNNLEYIEFPFQTTKSSNNMFFDEKQKILSRIDNFLNNQEDYIRMGIPYTLGILLHGLSGVGKTSVIKMIAKYTKRHIVIVPLNKIQDIETLRLIMLSQEINHLHIPTDKRLYVFEDADCSTWKDILFRRDLLPEYAKPDHRDEVLAEVLFKLSEPKDKIKPKKSKNTITLADMLELLDGLIEMDGRMIIMTTNHINMLDTALIRPGRFDLNLELKELSEQNINDIYKLWFHEKSMPANVKQDIIKQKYTQAEIGNLFASYVFK